MKKLFTMIKYGFWALLGSILGSLIWIGLQEVLKEFAK